MLERRDNSFGADVRLESIAVLASATLRQLAAQAAVRLTVLLLLLCVTITFDSIQAGGAILKCARS